MLIEDDDVVEEEQHAGDHPDDLGYKVYDVLRGKSHPYVTPLQCGKDVTADFILSCFLVYFCPFQMALKPMV